MELQNAHCYHGGNPRAVPPSIRDIVLVEDEDKPHCLWKLAKVTYLITGRDGYTRGGILCIPSTRTTLQQPLQHLYPLEMTVQSVPVTQETHDNLEPIQTVRELERTLMQRKVWIKVSLCKQDLNK